VKQLDRIDAIRAFIAAVDEGSLSAAARRLHRSPAAVTRSIAFLEEDVGVELLHRTTRALGLSDAGERYAVACRRILADLDEARLAAAGAHAAPRGLLTITAPVMFGTRVLRPVLDAFLAKQRAVQARYLLIDRVVNLADEGIDVALRIAHLPDSGLIATRVGEVRRVVAASPAYLAGRPAIRAPADLAHHDCIAHTGGDQTGPGQTDVWTFPPRPGASAHRNIRVSPRLSVNAIDAAVRSAADGRGVVRVLSYQIEEEVRDGRLVILLEADEPEPFPVHLVMPDGRLGIAKVRAFVDYAAPRLKAKLRVISDRGPQVSATRASQRGRTSAAHK
jgi:DNA-binding transcriptional LysR family regulator